ncbi:CAP domain-containing protein [Ureibacillus sinduriensis]|uniref:SCP domain-containing protein n=1 Tax=Ureibacillus sinduriensis BLB-1 = JCM 15800 TaxID=1384057 RepID=A0A0A3HWU9_9BACL|nr:CAP domain-containing protein [Ureibacillus sinduriensis]KGR76914.1 hypothetical protein CD33_04360 [Ureibacillus sinduriensis BLB-1 = JCM 15800]
MKKWFITFCALGLISTQAQAADAASYQEDSQYKNIEYEVKVVNANHYGDLLADFKDEISQANIHSLKELSTKLPSSKEELEKFITAHLKGYNNNTQVEKTAPLAPSENETTNELLVKDKKTEETTEAVIPSTSNSGKGQVEAPVVKPPTSPTAPSVPSEEVQKSANATSKPVVKEGTVSAFETEVVELTNAERAKNGLAPLQAYEPLMKVAGAKSQDMAANNYFSHTSPTYGSPFDQIKASGITYRAAGENIAQGQRTPEEVVQAWMNSEGHRANILNTSYTHIGVGYVEDGNYWTQQFIQR